jgi:hypothetical protein
LDAPRLAQYPAWQLAQIAIDDGDRESLLSRNSQLIELCDTDLRAIETSFIAGHLCHSAIVLRNEAEARDYLQKAKAAQPRFPTKKANAYLTALELGVELLAQDWVPSELFLESAQERHRLISPFTKADFFTSVLGEALLRVDRTDDARNLLTRYVQSSRRERGRPGVALAATLAKVL